MCVCVCAHTACVCEEKSIFPFVVLKTGFHIARGTCSQLIQRPNLKPCWSPYFQPLEWPGLWTQAVLVIKYRVSVILGQDSTHWIYIPSRVYFILIFFKSYKLELGAYVPSPGGFCQRLEYSSQQDDGGDLCNS